MLRLHLALVSTSVLSRTERKPGETRGRILGGGRKYPGEMCPREAGCFLAINQTGCIIICKGRERTREMNFFFPGFVHGRLLSGNNRPTSFRFIMQARRLEEKKYRAIEPRLKSFSRG